MSTNITMSSDDSSFQPAESRQDEDWVDTSFAGFESSEGDLRFTGANNGRYNTRQPIEDRHGNLVGHMADASGLGYTYHCAYSDRVGRFLISREPFFTPGSLPRSSTVALVGQSGAFFFRSRGVRYAITDVVVLPQGWPSSTAAFKLLDDGELLFMLADGGFCLIDIRKGSARSLVKFDEWWQHRAQGFAISPKVKILAIPFSYETERDAVTDEQYHRNVLRLYDLTTGRLVGEKQLKGRDFRRWKIAFSEDGRLIRATSDGQAEQLRLEAQ